MSIRSTATRVEAAKARLESEPNVWIATASGDGMPHLLPLSLAWDGSNVLCVTPTGSPTVRNIEATGRARASLDDADNVVLINASATATDYATLDQEFTADFVVRVGWDPANDDIAWSLLTLTPETIFSWSSEAEIEGRTIMRAGAWLT